MRKFNLNSISAILAISAVGDEYLQTAQTGCRLSGKKMGKRSSFERREADFYPTPRAAVVPLIPYLRGHPHLCRAVCRRRRPGPASEILRPALRLFRRHSQRSGRAGDRLLRRVRFNHHEPALVARRAAPADRAFPEHRAHLAVAGLRLGADQTGCAVPAPLLGHRGDRPREMDRGIEAHRQGQCRLVQVRRPSTWAALSFTGATGHRSRFASNFEAAHLRAMRQGLRAAAAIQFTVLFAGV